MKTLLADADVVDLWSVPGGEGTFAYRALLRLDAVEILTDALSARLESDPSFRVVLLAVEATLPPVEDDSKEKEEATPTQAPKGRDRVSREELLQELTAATDLNPVFLTTVVLSTFVASVGLLRGDVAVIIGAMVIAPLLGPNVALSLAATLGDWTLGRRAIITSATGAAVALAVSLMLGALVSVDPSAPELAARTRIGLPDVVLALAAGSAGALSYTSGIATAVIGVMVAVALLPPLVATGLLAGAGYGSQALAAATLVATNVTCVNLAGVATFLARRVTPRDWWEVRRARTTTLWAIGTWIGLLALLVALMLFAWA